MKCIILAGGYGSRLSEETLARPKPMVEIGGKPILWHIMKIYGSHGINEFIVCLGYKGYIIKEYFANFALHTADITFDLRDGRTEFHQAAIEPWRVTLVETGADTETGGRLQKVASQLDDEPFCLTYGDGVGDVNIGATIDFHKSHGKLATVTAVQPLGRFGQLDISGDMVCEFVEKPAGDGEWINGGFFVLEPEAIEYVGDSGTSWEGAPLQALSQAGQLACYKHRGFWHPMDTLRDKKMLEELWDGGNAPWKVWN
jgi:glucose-1-phosphate cytidylyltransferase